MSMSVAGRRCWVVKGRAERNDFASVLRAGSCDRWFTKRPPRAWTRGDVVFVWESSPALRVVGVGLLVGFGTEGEDTVFLVRYVTDLLTNPVALSTIRAVPSLATASFTRAGAAGTVFPLDEAQAAQLAALVDDANRGLAAPMLGEFDDVTWPTRAISVRQPCGAYSWGRQDDRSPHDPDEHPGHRRDLRQPRSRDAGRGTRRPCEVWLRRRHATAWASGRDRGDCRLCASEGSRCACRRGSS
jgi:hypothetical protein